MMKEKASDELILAYLNGEATDAELKTLFAWVRESSENSDEFVRMCSMHGHLRFQLSGERSTQDLETAELEVERANGSDSPERNSKRQSTKTAVLALAASLALAIGLFAWLNTDDSKAFVTVAQTLNAKWESGKSIVRDDRLKQQTLRLRSGLVRLTFDNGVEVTLQGPAEYELESLGKTRLTSGLLTANVPPEAKGFQVDTPTAQVVDLGTTFGIRLGKDGVSNVEVFDGQVEVSPVSDAGKQRVREGEAVFVSLRREIKTTAFDAAAYEKTWPVASGIAGSTGAFRFTPPWPRRLRFVRSDDEIFVAQEGYATTLDQPLKVNISKPGKYNHEQNLTPSELPLGKHVRSFILHFHPDHDGQRVRFKRTTGSITFVRPVLGLIVLHQELADSASRFPGRKAGEMLEHRQLELTGARVGDIISLSDDRRTVTLGLAAPRRFSDLVRVIVDASR